MADLEQLKQKYAPVIATIQEFASDGATLDDVSLDGEQLHLKATVPSQVIANRVWDSIKSVDPQFADLHHEIITAGSGDQSYTVQPGDNLSHISKHFYGTANHYQKIAEANGMANPDLVKVGQELLIPVL
ncbi:MAG TPA: LysM peptidoglycan-binding domain-containing protein [Acidisarcina sp.]|nr:LysM peptidoglycan-binding domain-containing protein [Acidisarcina sp.]